MVGVSVILDFARFTWPVLLIFVGAIGWVWFDDAGGGVSVNAPPGALEQTRRYRLLSAALGAVGLVMRAHELHVAAEVERVQGVAWLFVMRLVIQYVVVAHWLENAPQGAYGAHLHALRTGTVQPKSQSTLWAMRIVAVQEWILILAALNLLAPTPAPAGGGMPVSSSR